MLNKDPSNNPKINTFQQTPTRYDLHPLLTAYRTPQTARSWKPTALGERTSTYIM